MTVRVVACPGCDKRHFVSGAYEGIVNCSCGKWRWHFDWTEVSA